MAEQVETRVGADVVGDYDAICRVVQLYIDGASRGDVTKLEEAFHPDSRMFGALGGTRYDIPISTFFEMAQGMPADTGSYRGRIVAVHQTGDAASAIVAEDGYWGSVSFVDYFLLNRIDGSWKILCKTFAHVGGEPPTT